MKITLQKRLEVCPLFEGIFDLGFLTRCLHPLLQHLESGSRLEWRGSGRAAVVAEGRVRWSAGLARPGAVLGLEEAMTGKFPPAVTAERPSLLLLLPGDTLFRTCVSCCPEHRRLTENAVRLLAEHSLALRERQELLLIRGTRARLCTYLWRRQALAGKDTITLPYNRQALAEFLNLSRPSLSREFCLLRDEGVLEFYRETVRVLQPEILSDKLRFTKDTH